MNFHGFIRERGKKKKKLHFIFKSLMHYQAPQGKLLRKKKKRNSKHENPNSKNRQVLQINSDRE